MAELRRIWLTINREEATAWAALLTKSQLAVDHQVDVTFGMFEGETLLATASLYGQIIKCVAVDPAAQSENLLAPLIQAAFDQLRADGVEHAFIYTKPSTQTFFSSLGFTPLAASQDVVLLERGYPDLDDYLQFLRQKKRPGTAAAIVMNANPFTRGHHYLVTQAASQFDTVYVFVLSAEHSQFSAADRLAMVKLGTQDLPNVVVLPTRDYMVSSATFPSYFLKDRADLAVAKQQAQVDAALFVQKIAPTLAITTRFVGEEPLSPVTAVYNDALAAAFAGSLQLQVIPRLQSDGAPISATAVRQALANSDQGTLEKLLLPQINRYIKEHSSHAN
ncbi:[citrate (pro-3S)-lyase] ligase [Lacticaseibacillus baoqingensis]|uniref:[Citrate [pro-3S]-lyase] ligase n=1 Tax=Lacticaseibacillus baoqingensis TaxID=2486013 RepID=A0ABW4E606_9LACO|nr:[citrate (pro-3S)-lyase] ligase [Lacticaseibacillus baoqingensis]